MNDDASSKHTDHWKWLRALRALIRQEPKDRNQLIELLRKAEQRDILDGNSMEMIEGVFEIAQMQVRDIMVPRSHMVVVEIDDAPHEFLPKITQSSHSRFPVIGENRDEVVGIVLAKDLLKFNVMSEKAADFNLKKIIRPANVVPESKRLSVLLSEFRQTHNHMAIVIDEYGGVAGLVTIEDILEEIVGDIEDEFDTQDGKFIQPVPNKGFIVNGLTPIDAFNEYFNTTFSDEEFDTIGGFITHELGHLPVVGEHVTLQNLHFKVLNADKRRLRQLEVERV